MSDDHAPAWVVRWTWWVIVVALIAGLVLYMKHQQDEGAREGKESSPAARSTAHIKAAARMFVNPVAGRPSAHQAAVNDRG